MNRTGIQRAMVRWPREFEHPAVCVLPPDIADALGWDLNLEGTTRNNTYRVYPFEFSLSWQKDFEELGVWKPLTLRPSRMLPGEVPRGHASADDLRTRAHVLLRAAMQRPQRCRQQLRGATEARGAYHPIVQTLEVGDVVDLEGRTAVVLSQRALHANHPYRKILLAPVVPLIGGLAAEVPLSSATRIAYELARFVEIDSKAKVTTLGSAPTAAARAQGNLLALVGDYPLLGATSADALRYAREVGDSLRYVDLGTVLPLSRAGQPDALPPVSATHARVAIARKPIPRQDSGDAAARVGFDRIALDLGDIPFVAWFLRDRNRFSLLVEAVADDDVEEVGESDSDEPLLLGLVVDLEDGRTLTLNDGDFDGHSVARVDLDASDLPLRCRASLYSAFGNADLELSANWTS